MDTKVAIYARTATEFQNKDAIARQCQAVTAYVLKHGWSVQDIYVDRGVSGMGPHGVAFKNLLADSQKKMFDVLIVSDVSRISRNLVKLSTALKTFEALGVRVIGAMDGYDSARTSGSDAQRLSPALLDFQITPEMKNQLQKIFQIKTH